MSIEENIVELTRAINALTAAVLKTSQQAPQPQPQAQPAETKKPTPAKTEKPAATPSTAAASAAPETKAEPSAEPPDSVDFATQIQKPIITMAATGKRDAALAILKELGAARASDIKPEDYVRAVELIAKAG